MNRKSFLKKSLAGVIGSLMYPISSYGDSDFVDILSISKIDQYHIVTFANNIEGSPIMAGLNYAFCMAESKKYKVEKIISNSKHIENLIFEFSGYCDEEFSIVDGKIWGATLQKSTKIPFGSMVLLARNNTNEVDYFMLNGIK